MPTPAQPRSQYRFQVNGIALTPLGIVLFLVAQAPITRLAFAVANRIVLIQAYGCTRFETESLTFVATPRGWPWTVSNGDTIAVGFGHFLIASAIWLPASLITLAIILTLTGRRTSTPPS
jgi:hypothetical protein